MKNKHNELLVFPPNQRKAIAIAAYNGKKIQQEYGDKIKYLYRLNHSARKIVENLELDNIYKLSSSIATRAVSFALRGYMENNSFFHYNGLISQKEMEHLGTQHRRNAGKQMKQNKIGIHNASKRKLATWGSKGGREQYKLKIGIHRQTLEEKAACGRTSAEARNQIPWINEEKEEALWLHNQQANHKSIAHCLNYHYHQTNIRTTQAIRIKLWKLRHQKNALHNML